MSIGKNQAAISFGALLEAGVWALEVAVPDLPDLIIQMLACSGAALITLPLFSWLYARLFGEDAKPTARIEIRKAPEQHGVGDGFVRVCVGIHLEGPIMGNIKSATMRTYVIKPNGHMFYENHQEHDGPILQESHHQYYPVEMHINETTKQVIYWENDVKKSLQSGQGLTIGFELRGKNRFLPLQEEVVVKFAHVFSRKIEPSDNIYLSYEFPL